MGFMGCGNMASAIINGITNNNVVSEKDINAYDVFEGATKKLKENKAKLPAAKEFVEPLLKSDAPQVRGYAFSNIAIK